MDQHNHRAADLRRSADPREIDAGSSAVADMLDRLAVAERAGAPPGFADRVFESTRGELGPPVAARISPRAPARREPAWLTPLRAAAALALAATGAASILATRTQPAPVTTARAPEAPIETYIDAWASGSFGLDGLSSRVSALDAEMSALREDLSKGPGSFDAWAEEGAL